MLLPKTTTHPTKEVLLIHHRSIPLLFQPWNDGGYRIDRKLPSSTPQATVARVRLRPHWRRAPLDLGTSRNLLAGFNRRQYDSSEGQYHFAGCMNEAFANWVWHLEARNVSVSRRRVLPSSPEVFPPHLFGQMGGCLWWSPEESTSMRLVATSGTPGFGFLSC